MWKSRFNDAATSSCVESGLEAQSTMSAPASRKAIIRFAVSLVTCRQAETRSPFSGCSLANRLRMDSSTGICCPPFDLALARIGKPDILHIAFFQFSRGHSYTPQEIEFANQGQFCIKDFTSTNGTHSREKKNFGRNIHRTSTRAAALNAVPRPRQVLRVRQPYAARRRGRCAPR